MDEKLWKLLREIPRGKVTTYGNLARVMGTSPRAVGAMLRSNPYAPKVPCHRVVMSDGSLGGYSKGVKIKKELLEKEGVDVKNLLKHLWVPKYTSQS